MPLKKYLTYVGIAFVVFYMLKQPTNAANAVNHAAGSLAGAANSLSKFVGALS